MAKKYCIWVVSPHGYSHSRAFDEIALGLQCAFREIGYEVSVPCSCAEGPAQGMEFA